MTDLSTIKDSPWGRILTDWRKGRIDRVAIVRALESGEPMPVQANALIAGLLSGALKATRGLKPRKAKQGSGWERSVADLAKYVEKQLRVQTNRSKVQRPGEEARKVVAAIRGVTPDDVRRAITSARKRAQKS